MCDECNDELSEGRQAARMLVEHLLNMGADTCHVPVTVAGREYNVTVQPADRDSPPTRIETARKN